MTLEATLAELVKQAVSEAVAPLKDEIARLRCAQEEEGISIEEAAQRLHVSRRTIERRVKSGDLPSVKMGGSVRIPLSAVLPRSA